MKKLSVYVFIFLMTTNLYANRLDLETTYTVAFAQNNLKNRLYIEQILSIEKALAKYSNINFIYSDAKSSISMQIMQIEDYIMNSVDLIIISPFDEKLTREIVGISTDYEIPVLLINKKVTNLAQFMDGDMNEQISLIVQTLSHKK